MKKVVFVTIISFALFVVSNTIFANTDNEYTLALKHYNSGKYEEAIRLFKECLEKKPDPGAYYRIGYALYELGEYNEANRYFKEAYLVDPTFSPVPPGPYQKYPKKKTKRVVKPASKQIP